MTSHLPKLALLGLGTMGAAIAGTASRSGIPLVVWDRRPDAAAHLAAQHVEVAPSVTAAAAEADVVITMVTNADAVVSIATEQGLLAALRPGAVWAQMSTIGLEGTERIATMVKEQRPETYFVDAPVSGSKVPAEEGKLLIFASGPDDARSRVAPVFDAIGQRTLWLGPAGYGSRMKLVNNVLLAFTAEGVANSFALAHRLGLDSASVIRRVRRRPARVSLGVGKVPPHRSRRVFRRVRARAGLEGRPPRVVRGWTRPVPGARRVGRGVDRDGGPGSRSGGCHSSHAGTRWLIGTTKHQRRRSPRLCVRPQSL